MFIVVMGVSGCGKTSVGQAVAEHLDVAYLEGDSFHPAANIDKMSAGIPLNDDDRQPWLATLAGAIADSRDRGEPGLVLACSALKKSYRAILRQHCPELVLVNLAGTRDVIAGRMGERRGHYMPLSLLDSQLATLEPPATDERCITVDIDRPLAAIVADTLDQLAAMN